VALSAAAAGCTAQRKDQQAEPQASQQRVAVATPADCRTAVQDAELCGHALYDSYVAPNVANEQGRGAGDRDRPPVRQRPLFRTYRAVAVMPPSAPKDRIVIYDIGEAPALQGIMVGATIAWRRRLTGRACCWGEPSTTGCIILPPVRDERHVAECHHRRPRADAERVTTSSSA